jgi:hypothetical protein
LSKTPLKQRVEKVINEEIESIADDITNVRNVNQNKRKNIKS